MESPRSKSLWTGLLAAGALALFSLLCLRSALAPRPTQNDLVRVDGRVAAWSLTSGRSVHSARLRLEGRAEEFFLPGPSLGWDEMKSLAAAEPAGSAVELWIARPEFRRPYGRVIVYRLRSARREYLDVNQAFTGALKARLNACIGAALFAVLAAALLWAQARDRLGSEPRG